MTTFKQREIVVIPFPFTDLSTHKQRPCLILSNQNYNNSSEDVVVLALTSSITYANDIFSIRVDNQDMESGDIPKTSFVRVGKIFTAQKTLIKKRVSLLRERKFQEVINCLHQNIL